ncbi:MAG TPA: hypothetical protein VGE01_11170 [Fimbriimonas sp.]
MKRDVSGNHPLRAYFHEALQESLESDLRLTDVEDVEVYLEELLLRFISQEEMYVRDPLGQPIESVAEMLLEGDVRYGADSFDREREIHRHIGDLLMFWSGLFPGMAKGSLLDPVQQGSQSYYVVSTFEFGAYAAEATLFRKLSDGFADYRYGLQIARGKMGLA